jgi:polysaccharide export outer membrane protein
MFTKQTKNGLVLALRRLIGITLGVLGVGCVSMALMLGGCARQAIVTKEVAATKVDPVPYMIGKDDVIDVIVWKEPQLSGKVRVAEDGTVTIPLVGPVPAQGQTCEQLQSDLTKRLAEYTRNPNVTVRVAVPASQLFYILGEVRKPGSYPLRSDEVLSQALAQAGGLTEFADEGGIRIVRRNHDKTLTMTVNYRGVAHGDLQADLPLEAGDTITVP